MSVTSAQLKKFETEYIQTSGICFQFTYSKIRKNWVAYSFNKKFEEKEFADLLAKVTEYIQSNRIEKPKVNYQFQFKFWAKK